MKKLMILGAGVYQVPLIKKAKEMGVFTIVVSIPGDYPGFKYADKVIYENTTDSEAILAIARNEKINGICTTGTDVAVITIGKVCDELGLTGLSFEAGKIATDKMLMKKRYEEFGVRTAKFRQIYFSDKNWESQIEGLKCPLILKAVDTSGSRGIIRVNNKTEFENAKRLVQANTKKDYFIVEEFLIGEEFGAQAFIYHGEIQFILPHGDYVFHGNTGVPIGHWAPYDLDASIIADAKAQLQMAATAMKLDNCALNADFILADGKTYVLEIGGRAGATCLVELVSLYFNYNYYEKIIQAALGEEIDFSSNEANPNVGMLLKSDKDGVIKEIINHNPVDDLDIVEIHYDYNVGSSVSKFQVGPHRIGHVVVKGESVETAKRKMEEVLKNIEIIVD